MNTNDDCRIDFGISASFGTPGTYTCNDSLTQAGLHLGNLTEMGGTWVHPLQEGSPFIDAGGPSALCPSVDQRGVSRPLGSTCDIGAFEYALALIAATPESTPDIVPLEIATFTPEPFILTFTANAFCRKGPATRYFDVTTFNKGDQAQVDGRNDTDPRWWWVLLPNSTDHCWVSNIVFEADENLEILPVQPAPNLPDPPAYFDSTPTCKPNDNIRDVRLNWPGVQGATGYRIYRNSTLIATLGADIGIYVNAAPYSQDVTYELEAINQDGASERLITISGDCK